MLQLFFTTTLLLLAGFSPVAHAAGEECDEVCQNYRQAIPRSPVPTDVELVCFHFEQPAPDAVYLLVYDKKGRRINAGNERHVKDVHSEKGKFCIGAHYVRRAEQIILCNGLAHATIGREGINWLLEWNASRHYTPWRTPPKQPVKIFPTGKIDPAWERFGSLRE